MYSGLELLEDLALPQTPPSLVLALTQTQMIWCQLHHSHKAYLIPSSSIQVSVFLVILVLCVA